MSARPVPRNIDKPNRNAEYAFSFMGSYFITMFLFHEALLSIFIAISSIYFIYKVTLDKPEGQSYRLFYRYYKIGKMIPTPRFVKRFEI